MTVDWILTGKEEAAAGIVAEERVPYGDVRDKIMDMLADMDEEGRQYIFDHIKATKRLLKDEKKKLKEGA